MKELLFNKRNLIVIGIVILIMIVGSLLSGWGIGLEIHEDSQWIAQLESNVETITLTFTNTVFVWAKSGVFLNVLAPFLIVIPYLMLHDNRNESTLTLVSSGMLTVLIGELLFYSLTYFVTLHHVDYRYYENIGVVYHNFFREFPYFYLLFSFVLKYFFYFCLTYLSISTAKRFNKKALSLAVIVLMIVGLQLSFDNHAYLSDNILNITFNVRVYAIMMMILLVMSVFTEIINKKQMKKNC